MSSLRFFLLAACLSGLSAAQAQTYLVLDRYTPRRTKIALGEEIHYRLKGQPGTFHDVLGGFVDSDTLLMAGRKAYIGLEDVSEFRFDRGWPRAIRGGTYFVGLGFLISALVQPAIPAAQYSREEHFVLSGSFLVMGQITRPLDWKRFRLGKRGRARIIDTTFRTTETAQEP